MRRGVTDAVDRGQRSLHNVNTPAQAGGGEAFQGAEEGFSKGLRLAPGGTTTNALPKSVWALTFKLHTAVFPTELPGNAPTAHHPISPSQLALLSLEDAV